MRSSEGPWDIPPSWVWTCMGEIAEVVGGGTPRTSDPANWDPPTVAWITPADLSGYKAKTITHGKRFISEEGLARSGARLMPPGTVLFSSRAPIGYVAIAAAPVATNQGFKSFVLKQGVLPDYVYYYLLGNKSLALALASGTTFPEISGKNAAGIPFPLAPFTEQKRIVEAIEAHLSRLDAAVAALERVRVNLKRYRASVLKAACEGRLVPTEAQLARREGRDYEPADVLLERILRERRTRWEAEELERLKAKGKPPTDDRGKQKYKEPEPLDTNELPSLPEGWTWAPLAALGELKGGITKGFKPRAGEVHREVPYLRVANVQRGYLDLTDVRTIRAPLEKIEALRLQPGDVLFNEGGDRDKLGRGWIWSGEIPECIHQNHVFRARLYLPDLQPKYISWYANSAGQEYFVRQGKQTTNLASINLTKLGSLPVALPPAAEQARIAQEIERRLSLVDSMQTALETAGRRAERLRHAILQHAFTGRLVPQDPNDEPASTLLERIRARRHEQTELAIARSAT